MDGMKRNQMLFTVATVVVGKPLFNILTAFAQARSKEVSYSDLLAGDRPGNVAEVRKLIES